MKSNFQHYEEVNEIKSTKDQIKRFLLDEKGLLEAKIPS